MTENEFSQLFHLGSKKYYSLARQRRVKKADQDRNRQRQKAKTDLEPTRPDYINYLISRRYSKGLTQQKLAAMLRTSQSFISYFETGRDNPTLDFLMRYCQAVGEELILRITTKK